MRSPSSSPVEARAGRRGAVGAPPRRRGSPRAGRPRPRRGRPPAGGGVFAPQPLQAGHVSGPGSTLIRTDVIVRDADGVFVPDLAPTDFQVHEDGMPQEVASLVLVHGGRVFNQLSPAPVAQEGIMLPTSRNVNNTAALGSIFIFFVDAMHLMPESTPRVRHFVKEVGRHAGARRRPRRPDLERLGGHRHQSHLRPRAREVPPWTASSATGLTPRELIMDMQEGTGGAGRAALARPPRLHDREHPPDEPGVGAGPAQGAALRQHRLRRESVRAAAAAPRQPGRHVPARQERRSGRRQSRDGRPS